MNVCSKCTRCGARNSLSLLQNDKRKGLCEEQLVKCTVRENMVMSTKTSYTLEEESKQIQKQKADINIRSVLGITSSGAGLSALRTFCASLNFPLPVYPKSFNNIVNIYQQLLKKYVTVVWMLLLQV